MCAPVSRLGARVAGKEVDKCSRGEVSQNLIVNLMLLVTPVVGMTSWAVREGDLIIPPHHHQLRCKGKESVVFVLGVIVGDESELPGEA